METPLLESRPIPETHKVAYEEVGAGLVEQWALVFTHRPADHIAMSNFLPHTQPSGIPLGWFWTHGTQRETASHARDSTLGMHGLGYSCWLHSPGCCLDALGAIAERAQDGAPLFPALHASSHCLYSES